MRLLILTSEWPTPTHPEWAPFLVNQVRELRRAGLQVDVFPFRGAQNPLRYFQAWLRLRKQYALKTYDLIHAHFGQSGLVALPTPVPLVVTFHGSDLQGIVNKQGKYTIRGKLLQALSRLVARRAAAIILVSAHLARFLPVPRPPSSVHVIPCGVNLDLFKHLPQADCRRQLGMPLDQTFILFPASPSDPVKRFPLAQAAVNHLRKTFPSQRATCNVELVTLDNIPHEQVPLYLNACDVLLLTSHHEGSPTVVKEALACNLPIVSVDVGDVRERISGIDGCVLCEDDTPETIAGGLTKVLLRGERVNGREAVADLDERRIAERIISVYHQALYGANPV